MIVARILEPSSKLAIARGFQPETAASSLASVLGLDGAVDETQLYPSLDWRVRRNRRNPLPRSMRARAKSTSD
jgi:hypothetical protein